MFGMLHSLFIAFITQTTNLYVHSPSPIIHKLEVLSVARLRTDRGRDRAVLQLDFEFDLSNLFDWNCKQVFVFIEASYSAPGRPNNRIVVWDHVVLAKEDAKSVRGPVFAKYEMDAVGQELRGVNGSIRLGWDTMPILGLVGKHSQLKYMGRSDFVMPATYGKFV